MTITKMSWSPQYRSSKFRHVYGKAASKEKCYDCVPITRSVHDNHFCAVNPHFVAVVTECAGGGAFLVIPVNQTGKLDPHYPRICGHKGNVLDIKWNPFDDFVIASCSEDTTVKVWNIPHHLLTTNITDAQKELLGHSRRVGLIEWHPTASNILFSTGYDYKIMIWNLDTKESVIETPVKTIHFHTDVILSMSFNTDGSLLATACRDRKIRVIDPRAGTVLQEANNKSHRVNKVLFLGNMKKLLSTGTSRWNNRQIALWDQGDLSVPLVEEDMDGSSGLLFPFYDSDTHMLYVLGKGDGNIRYYEISSEKPYLNYLMEYRSPLPQKGIGFMPKRGLDVSSCEIFRFYKLIPAKYLIEPVSMIVPRRVSESLLAFAGWLLNRAGGWWHLFRCKPVCSGISLQSESYQEDIYPMTAGAQPALTAQEWLSGSNKGPVLMSLRPGSVILNSLPPLPVKEAALQATEPAQLRTRVADIIEKPSRVQERWVYWKAEERGPEDRKIGLSNGFDVFECPPPKTENELLQMFYRQQEEIRRLRELTIQRDVQIKQLELEIKNLRMDSGRF
ncbi:coronin-2A isoform X1 [Podarcis lilfordi]|uniref:Coronin n=1 Tax=Podarcis lilfordi TaxID=74358 RepID=A0AA35LIT0_9SAUR|nr:coronin-2A isoform X1 [Podarcis lilfordi]